MINKALFTTSNLYIYFASGFFPETHTAVQFFKKPAHFKYISNEHYLVYTSLLRKQLSESRYHNNIEHQKESYNYFYGNIMSLMIR